MRGFQRFSCLLWWSARVTAALLSVATLVPLLAAEEQAESITGEWFGRIEVASGPALIRVTISNEQGGRPIATVRLLPSTPDTRNLTKLPVAVNDRNWVVAAGSAPHQFRLEVRQAGDSGVAAYELGSEKGTGELRHSVAIDDAVSQRRQGSYLLPSGENIYIRLASPIPPKVLTYLEQKTGRSGILFPISRDTYVAGPSYYLPSPQRVSITFQGDAAGQPTALLWSEKGRDPLVARRSAAYTREETRLTVDGAVLGCEALIPAGGGKH